MWANLYPAGSKSRDIIAGIENTYYLVNLVDNDYVAGNCLFRLLERMEEKMVGEITVLESVKMTDLNIIEPRTNDVEYVGEPIRAMSYKTE